MTTKLHHGDCLDVMRDMDADSVDAVVTDPPYGIGFKYETHIDDAAAYDDLITSTVTECQRIVRPGGWCFVWQTMKNIGRLSEWFPSGYRVFAAVKNFVQFRPTPIQYSWDPVVFWSIGKPDGKPVAGIRDYHIGNTAKWVAQKNNGHPCPRPLDTVTYITDLCGDTILDPFMGSGTTGVACVNLERNFIGIEIDEKYHNIARDRIALAQFEKDERDRQTEMAL